MKIQNPNRRTRENETTTSQPQSMAKRTNSQILPIVLQHAPFSKKKKTCSNMHGKQQLHENYKGNQYEYSRSGKEYKRSSIQIATP
ncbi:unnamed protein product, partial [Brassica oleracea]